MATIVGKDVCAVKRTTCKNCAAVLEYTPSDIERVKHNYDYLGDYETSNGIRCPSCRKYVFI